MERSEEASRNEALPVEDSQESLGNEGLPIDRNEDTLWNERFIEGALNIQGVPIDSSDETSTNEDPEFCLIPIRRQSVVEKVVRKCVFVAIAGASGGTIGGPVGSSYSLVQGAIFSAQTFDKKQPETRKPTKHKKAECWIHPDVEAKNAKNKVKIQCAVFTGAVIAGGAVSGPFGSICGASLVAGGVFLDSCVNGRHLTHHEMYPANENEAKRSNDYHIDTPKIARHVATAAMTGGQIGGMTGATVLGVNAIIGAAMTIDENYIVPPDIPNPTQKMSAKDHILSNTRLVKTAGLSTRTSTLDREDIYHGMAQKHARDASDDSRVQKVKVIPYDKQTYWQRCCRSVILSMSGAVNDPKLCELATGYAELMQNPFLETMPCERLNRPGIPTGSPRVDRLATPLE